jgi:hypothetical protein
MVGKQPIRINGRMAESGVVRSAVSSDSADIC